MTLTDRFRSSSRRTGPAPATRSASGSRHATTMDQPRPQRTRTVAGFRGPGAAGFLASAGKALGSAPVGTASPPQPTLTYICQSATGGREADSRILSYFYLLFFTLNLFIYLIFLLALTVRRLVVRVVRVGIKS